MMNTTKFTITYSHILNRSIPPRWKNNVIRIIRTYSTTATFNYGDNGIDSTKPPPPTEQQQQSFNIPKRLRQKVVGIDDAVSLISNNDTISCSGFVAQGTSIDVTTNRPYSFVGPIPTTHESSIIFVITGTQERPKPYLRHLVNDTSQRAVRII